MIFFVVAISAALAAAAIVEYRIHITRIRAIPVRILVNGTRGKSTVSRLVAAGLTAGGLRTYAKTTGSAARLILPDLREVSIRRRGSAHRRASIMEHRWFVREAHKNGAQALVAECMAIQPETIRTLETRLAHSTIGVITNVRLDHMDTMGTELTSVAEALAESVPERGRLFVGLEGMDEAVKEVFARKAARRGAELRFVNCEEETQSLCGQFSYPMFAQNLALALAVCETCGVSREVALRGMLGAAPDPGVRSSLELVWRGIAVRVVNAFAANDAQSTLAMWRAACGDSSQPDSRADGGAGGGQSFRALVFNHREDRAWRALQLGEIAAGMSADAILVYGMGQRLARRTVRGYYRRNGLQNGSQAGAVPFPVVRSMRDADVGAVLETIRSIEGFSTAGESARIEILCAGNIKGQGLALTDSFAATLPQETEKAFQGRA
ncbi:putative Capsule biosynthesis protein CapB [uncultured spirochete]|uniref:Putative Capsule biosynthesis protein CapB n=1 Tax=uncultured spirochete TaxID=156406 RepID=A0A3P3XQJ3_9SPIR|nr:putative Capsule biosynthesis protein CapB [uncultured spirochete]